MFAMLIKIKESPDCLIAIISIWTPDTCATSLAQSFLYVPCSAFGPSSEAGSCLCVLEI